MCYSPFSSDVADGVFDVVLDAVLEAGFASVAAGFAEDDGEVAG